MTDTNTKLSIIRTQADELGVTYHHRAGVTKIQGLINDFLVKQQHTTPNETLNEPADSVQADTVYTMDPAKYKQERVKEARRTVGKLVRCRIQNMNPNKKDWPGEILSVGSAKLGTFKKYIPFDLGEAYHVPQILFDMMKDKMCSLFYNSTNVHGHKIRKSRLIHEFALEVLPPLTVKELGELSRKQALAIGQGM